MVTFIAEELLELHSNTEFTFWLLMPRQAALDASGVAEDLCCSPVRVWYLHQAEGLSMVPAFGTVLGVPLEEVTAVSPLGEGGNTAEVLAQGGPRVGERAECFLQALSRSQLATNKLMFLTSGAHVKNILENTL